MMVVVEEEVVMMMTAVEAGSVTHLHSFGVRKLSISKMGGSIPMVLIVNTLPVSSSTNFRSYLIVRIRGGVIQHAGSWATMH